MSLSRHILNEMRPLIRVFNDPFFTDPFSRSSITSPFQLLSPTSQFGARDFIRTPSMHISEEGNHYVLEAELPGVKKEDLNIRIENDGSSVTVEGQTVRKAISSDQGTTAQIESADGQTSTNSGEVAPTTTEAGQVATPTPPQSVTHATSAFSRTIWLPQKVDSSDVSAKLIDGVLTLRVPKMADKEAVKIEVE